MSTWVAQAELGGLNKQKRDKFEKGGGGTRSGGEYDQNTMYGWNYQKINTILYFKKEKENEPHTLRRHFGGCITHPP